MRKIKWQWLLAWGLAAVLAVNVTGCSRMGGNAGAKKGTETEEQEAGSWKELLSGENAEGNPVSGENAEGNSPSGENADDGENPGTEADGDKGAMTVWNREFPSDVKLPEAYDYRQEGRAPGIGNQGTLGTCWAFASLTALSTTLMPEEQAEFSVDHMSMYDYFLLGQNGGGEYTMSMAYLLAWKGPVWEWEDPYGDGYSPEGLLPVKHVQEIQILPSGDLQAIKEAVYLYGGVQSSLYTSMKDYESESIYYNRDTNSYCYMGREEPNHDSVIIGWDDNYPKENFNIEVEGDGAFICTNSWGEDFGDQGYFYVSYYDSNIGVHNVVYTGVEETDNYDHIYQTDLCGWAGQIGYGQDEVWMANVYEAGQDEVLSAAGFYATDRDTEYEIYAARHLPELTKASAGAALNGRRPLTKGRLQYSGFYTVPLEEKIQLEDGEKFAIIVKIKTPGTIHPAAIEYDAGDGIAQVDLGDGEGYLSHDGNVWEHVEETQGCNLCLKAYTRDR